MLDGRGGGECPRENLMKRENLRPLPARSNHLCFGCSPINPYGLQMRFHTDGEALYSWVTVPEHLSGWKNLVHGGVITTMLDETMGTSAIFLLRTLVVTKSITVDFLRPVPVGQELKVEGRLHARNGSREVAMDGFLSNPEGVVCARASGVFALLGAEAAARFGMDESLQEDLAHFVSA